MKSINVLFLAAEADPFVKVGGLGDVAGSLPRALNSLDLPELRLDVRLVLPYHPVVRSEGLRPLGVYSLAGSDGELQVEAFETNQDGLTVYFISGEPIRANGSVYSLDSRMDAEKYVFFALAALELPNLIGWQPDILHANDWHTSLSLYGSLAKRWEGQAPPVSSLLTLHNLPFMGPEVGETISRYGYKHAQTDLPDWARGLPLPLGLWASDRIVAVSPTYAAEILTSEHGCGLEEFLTLRRNTVRGILNGIDVHSFNPLDDPAIGANYDADRVEQRAPNKRLLQERLGLPVDEQVPLLAVISRMDVQKGVDLAIAALKNLRRIPHQAVILGTGDPKLEQAAAHLQEMHPQRVRVAARFDAGLARQIYAGADMLLMPSRYEPCGLAQMIAMRYGCIPIVRATGGLNDTVRDGVTGFVFTDASAKALGSSIRSALKVLRDPDRWRAMQQEAMRQDFSWENSARQYAELYQGLAAS